MKCAIVFFHDQRKRRKKLIKKLTRKPKKKIKIGTISLVLTVVVLCISAPRNKKNKTEDYTIMESPLQAETINGTLKKYVIDMNNINYYNSENYQKIVLGGVEIYNYSTTRNIDFNKVFQNEIKLNKKEKVLIYSTHASETYHNSNRYKFGYSGTYRSQDENFNMLKIGEILGNNLKLYNIKFNHNKTPHDYNAYVGAYKKSRETMIAELQKDKYSLCLDMHRDALGNLDQALTTEIDGKKYAKLMFVVGMGTTGLYNKYALDNLSLALNIMALAKENYNNLFRPIIIRSTKYNQDLNKYSLIVECGTTGNTIDEVENSMFLFAKLLNEFYKN